MYLSNHFILDCDLYVCFITLAEGDAHYRAFTEILKRQEVETFQRMLKSSQLLSEPLSPRENR